jgi:hypothetical protein
MGGVARVLHQPVDFGRIHLLASRVLDRELHGSRFAELGDLSSRFEGRRELGCLSNCVVWSPGLDQHGHPAGCEDALSLDQPSLAAELEA